MLIKSPPVEHQSQLSEDMRRYRMLHHGSTSHNWVVRVLLSINSFDEKGQGQAH